MILDPPGFSSGRRAGRFSAARDYGELAELAAGCVAPDGLLLACCNVAERRGASFRDQVLAGVAAAGRTRPKSPASITSRRSTSRRPADTEPYLKMLLLNVA